jgi:hypothetical protein
MNINTKTMRYGMRIRRILLLSFVFSIGFTLIADAQKMTSAQKKLFKKNFKEGTLLMDNTTINRSDERMSDTTIKFFQRCYALDSTNANVAYIIGKLYMATAMHKAASLPYLQKAVTNVKKKYHPSDPSEKHAPPMAYYWLARSQHVNYQFDAAIDNFNTFKKMIKDGGERPKDIAYWVSCCNNAKDLMQNPVACKVTNVGETVNSTYDDYAPVITADETQMYFTSKRPMVEDTAHDKEGIWMTTSAGPGKAWGMPMDPGAPLNALGGNSATVSITPDGQMMMIYGSQSVDNGEVYISKLLGTMWDKPGKIDSSNSGVIDAKGSKYFTPSACLSPDGKTLYFSSNRQGGTGGLDLYRSDKGADGNWGSPQSLGSNINTKYDEDCPFVSFDGSLLFFSSKGHNTMGGYDVFMCKSDGQGGWGDPQNLGYPVNTPDDDKFFVLSPDGKRGYYNTVRLGTMGERDIYQVTFNTPLPVQCVGVMVGYYKTSDGSPIPADAKATCSDGTNTITVPVNSATGKYLAIVKPNVNYSVSVMAGGKQVKMYNIMVSNDSTYCTVGRAFMSNDGMKPAPTAPPTPVAAKSKFGTEAYFVKYFGYNLDNISESDPDFPTLVANITGAAKDTKIIVSIESSASTVPTTKFGTNDKLASARAEALKKALSKKVKNMANVKFELKPSVNGPEYNSDAQDHAKYEKFQYVKAFIREDK